ncbi:hypothetical protein PQG02_05460 [Nostoc sp. UHCC 0926]|uniref:hypothetical protein n=1 Tax=unclassified Nostoc TaxID=2593658 RepID=UPI00235DCB23|nr:hypothetical protein [Nostoc sp. UHCC 0926]WDD33818.1 hypothetical protein PQG02_05460 [Nostoc sp. UHCC 0926]
MIPSVADKTPIPAKVWRRHTDPPGLWISVVIGSVSLHLLAFWLMRSSNAFSLWFPQQSQSVVPIELIDIAPKTKSITKSKSTAKTVSPRPLSSTQKSVPARSIQTARTTPRNQDFGAINSAENLQQKSRTYASQSNSRPFRQQRVLTATPKPTSTSTSTPTPTPTPIATPKPTVPVGSLPWNRRQEIKLGKGTPLSTGIPSNPPVSEAENRETPPRTSTQENPSTRTRETPSTRTRETPPTRTRETPPTRTRETPSTRTRETPPTRTRETPATPTRETPPTRTRETPSTPTRETPATPTGGASVAIVAPLLRDKVSNLIQSGKLRQDALPDVIALYRGSNTKQLDSSFLPGDSEVKPAQILASLVIDNKGNFQQALVIEIEPATSQSEKSTYERILNEVFKTENFLAAHNNDGTKPDLSNLYVWIKIQPANSN